MNEYIGSEDLSPAGLEALRRLKEHGEERDWDSFSPETVLSILKPLSKEDRRAVLQVVGDHGEVLKRQGYAILAGEKPPDALEPSDFG